ncbi:hypothetical protein Q427_04300 [Halomonas sp. BC04]|nr:hypothetical protein Q427_04300 [Halomonas sp. BC04]
MPARSHRLLYCVLTALLVLFAVTLATLLVAEARTSHFQAQELSRYAGTLRYTLAPGKSDRILFPSHGPFDQRLGYTQLPTIETRLQSNGYAVTQQARFSPPLMEYTKRGFFPPYTEKTQAGLTLLECRGETFYAFRHPQRHYSHFDAVPPLMLQVLLFIENRHLLDDSTPYANPAVDWPRFTMAAVSQVGRALDVTGQSSGGSTLATQLEKYRHSPGGLTGSPMEKLRQMVSASVRSYRHGPQTLSARQDVALDYINSVPLAAAPGYGEVHGIGDALWVWFGEDFDTFNRTLSADGYSGEGPRQQGLALRQVVALMIAQRRPSWYLNGGRQGLEQLTDSYLRLLAEEGVISPALRDAALGERLAYRDFSRDPAVQRIEQDKGLQTARGRLGSLLGQSFYDLDRLDLSARTTLHGELQEQVTAYLHRLADPEFADEIGLFGDRLLAPEKTQEVRYSFTLYERAEDSFRVRVQTDNTGQPFDINEGSKLELGSTAKLRVLATYLEVIAELHRRYAGKPVEALRQVELDRQDVLSRWVVDSLANQPDLSLAELLDAAMERRYSASPNEAYFTGGGRHTFSNFRREDDGRNPMLKEAMRESLNLPSYGCYGTWFATAPTITNIAANCSKTTVTLADWSTCNALPTAKAVSSCSASGASIATWIPTSALRPSWAVCALLRHACRRFTATCSPRPIASPSPPSSPSGSPPPRSAVNSRSTRSMSATRRALSRYRTRLYRPGPPPGAVAARLSAGQPRGELLRHCRRQPAGAPGSVRLAVQDPASQCQGCANPNHAGSRGLSRHSSALAAPGLPLRAPGSLAGHRGGLVRGSPGRPGRADWHHPQRRCAAADAAHRRPAFRGRYALRNPLPALRSTRPASHGTGSGGHAT